MRRVPRIIALTLLGACIPIPLSLLAYSTFVYAFPGRKFGSPIFVDFFGIPSLGCAILFMLAAICSYIPPRGVSFIRSLILLAAAFTIAALMTSSHASNKFRPSLQAYSVQIGCVLVASLATFAYGFRPKVDSTNEAESNETEIVWL